MIIDDLPSGACTLFWAGSERLGIGRGAFSASRQILTLALAGGGVDATTPEVFLRCTPNCEADRAEISTAYGAPFAQLLVKKKFDRVMSGHGAMTSQEVQGQAIFARTSGIWRIRRRYRGFF